MSRIATDGDVTTGSWGSLTLTRKDSGVSILSMNAPGGVNSLSSEVLEHFRQALDFLARDEHSIAFIFTSTKPDMFIAGADIREISKFESESVAHDLSRRGTEIFQKIVELDRPVIAAINGVCLGGGLELALCCVRRIATDSVSTQVGLPEVTLGLIPGLGGTQRLPRLIGLKPAIELIISGEPVSARRAKELGIIDELTEPANLLERAEQLALELVASSFDTARYWNMLEASSLAADGGEKKRDSTLRMTERAVRIRTKGFYPAPAKAIDVVRLGMERGLSEGLLAESRAFAALAATPQCKNLINVYFTKEMAVQSARRSLRSQGKVNTLAIIGAGHMGSAIAEQSLSAGIDLILLDASRERTMDATDRLRRRIESRTLESDRDNAALRDRKVTGAVSYEDLAGADLVLEAVFEDESLKSEVIRRAMSFMKADSIFATNTSSLVVGELARLTDGPQRVVGLHFFSPVDRMPLVEVVAHEGSDSACIQRTMAMVAQIGKVPILVKDSPGFLVNRLLAVMLMEAAHLLDEQIPLEWVERAATDFGLPMGPLSLFDELGWSLATRVARLLNKRFPERFTLPTAMLSCEKLGLPGRKAGAGFYLYDSSGRKQEVNKQALQELGICSSDQPLAGIERERILDRLLLPMIDEAALCLEEKIVRKAREVDLALITGAAFPPFRGGLLRYADELGIDHIVSGLESINRNSLERGRPGRKISEFILGMKEVGRRFYGLGQ